MPRPTDRRLIGYLHGELPAAEVRQLRAELARDPALQVRLAELHRLWQGLQAPPPTPAPLGFVPRLQRLADQRRVAAGSSLLGWGAAPPWARALAGAALAGGVALGIGLGRVPPPLSPAVGEAAVVVASSPASPATPSPVSSSPAGPPAPPAPLGGVGDVPQPTDALEAPALTGDATLADDTALADDYWEALAGASGESAGGSSEASDLQW